MLIKYLENLMPSILPSISKCEFRVPSVGAYHAAFSKAPTISKSGIVLDMGVFEGSLDSPKPMPVRNQLRTVSKPSLGRTNSRMRWSDNASILPTVTPTFFMIVTPILLKSAKNYLEEAYFTFSYPVTLPRLSTWTFNVTLKDISNIKWATDTSISLRNGAIDVEMGISLSANAIITSDFFALKKASLTLDLSELILISSIGFELDKSSKNGNWKPLIQQLDMTFKKLQVCCITFNLRFRFQIHPYLE